MFNCVFHENLENKTVEYWIKLTLDKCVSITNKNLSTASLTLWPGQKHLDY